MAVDADHRLRLAKARASKRFGRNQHSHELGPYSSIDQLVKIDKRSRGYLYMKSLRAQLLDQLGHPASKVEMLWVEQCCWLGLRLLWLHQRIADQADLGQCEVNYYLAFVNSYCRTLARLTGSRKTKAKDRPSLEAILAEAAE